ncbi:protein of unknown function UPF0047 [Pyrolobus fumarii 1A]|uniref:YjbQ family protein n=1 Tax=Pyrolobus fumarii (strain DSM 11204 / 1A) TaxID=694429 RepID=G0EH43_PYRF1|nr:secondary thiamine-phosphate synthase enzyme YjbQ [Pyrolobus fumarii]AEM39267.1 protein of unknown function UPF0047 [Pyrolobus fumarii 1A]
MRIFFKEIRVSTSSRFEIIDITDRVEEVVHKSGICNGMVLVFAPHATAAIIANENEPGLVEDLLTLIREIFQPERAWRHNRIDDNAHAHLASAFIGASRVFPVKDCRVVRGTWQNIMLVEMDGPRTRRVIVEVMGE